MRGSCAVIVCAWLCAAVASGCALPLSPSLTPSLPAPCAAPSTERLERVVELSWLIGDAVRTVEVDALRGPTTKLWGAYGVQLVTTEQTSTALRSPFAPGGRDLASALAPLFQLVRGRAALSLEGVDVIVLERLVPAGSAAEGFFSRLDGLTLSPAHRETLSTKTDGPSIEARALYDALGLERFRPTVLVSARSPDTPIDLRVAHEVGHALGLDHVNDATNLMASSRRAGCAPILDDRQLARLRRLGSAR
jgi:hypothetical protein